MFDQIQKWWKISVDCKPSQISQIAQISQISQISMDWKLSQISQISLDCKLSQISQISQISMDCKLPQVELCFSLLSFSLSKILPSSWRKGQILFEKSLLIVSNFFPDGERTGSCLFSSKSLVALLPQLSLENRVSSFPRCNFFFKKRWNLVFLFNAYRITPHFYL